MTPPKPEFLAAYLYQLLKQNQSLFQEIISYDSQTQTITLHLDSPIYFKKESHGNQDIYTATNNYQQALSWNELGRVGRNIDKEVARIRNRASTSTERTNTERNQSQEERNSTSTSTEREDSFRNRASTSTEREDRSRAESQTSHTQTLEIYLERTRETERAEIVSNLIQALQSNTPTLELLQRIQDQSPQPLTNTDITKAKNSYYQSLLQSLQTEFQELLHESETKQTSKVRRNRRKKEGE